MSFSSGTFSINTAGQPVITGTVISSTAFNALTADLATGLSTCVLKDGTQTLTANIPMGGFKLTGLGAGTAAGNSLRYEQGLQSILTTTGDTIQTTAANTPARLPAAATVAAHATTCDPWNARVVTLSGSAVTFTDLADADYVGQQVLLIMNAAHIWTDGAVFDVQGGATYTTEAGDQVLLTATAVDAFDVTIFPTNGYAVGRSVTQTFLGADVNLNNTANYFNVVNTGSIGAAGQIWKIRAHILFNDTAGAARCLGRIWDGTSTVYVESETVCDAANNMSSLDLEAVVTLGAATTFYASGKDITSTSGLAKTTGNAGTANKATWIIAERVS